MKIFLLYNKGYSFRKIGVLLGRSHTSISREIQRNSNYLGWDRYEYHPIKAQKEYQERRDKASWRRHLFVKDPRLRSWLYQELDKRGSSRWVDEIIGRWGLETWTKPCSTSTIYRWLRIVGGNNERKLRYKSFGYKTRASNRQWVRYQDIPTIIERSKENEKRLELGHFECDTIVSARDGKGWLLTMVDRRSRFILIQKIDDLRWITVYKAMKNKLKNKEYLSLTIDNGSEFSKIRKFRDGWKEIYRCNPYRSWEKWTNETHNRMVRWWIYKGCDIFQESDAKIARVEGLLNHKPRKILWYRSPYEVYYNQELTYFS